MASNTDLNATGVAVETDIRKITTDERATAGQVVVAKSGTFILSGNGRIGARSQTGAVLNASDCDFIIKSDSNGKRRGTILYESPGSNGISTVGKVNLDRCKIVIHVLGSTDQFFTKLENSQVVTTQSGDQLVRFQDGGVFSGNYLNFAGQGAVELHGNVTIKGNTFVNLRGGFINFSTGLSLDVEAQDFQGDLDRLGFIHNGDLVFVDCTKDGSAITQAQARDFKYITYQTANKNRHIFFAKRQSFLVQDQDSNSLTANVEYLGDGLLIGETYVSSQVSHKQNLFRSNQQTHSGFNTTGAKITNWVDFIGTSKPIRRLIYQYGYVNQTSSWSSFEEFPHLPAGSIIKMQSNSSITERDKSKVYAYKNLETSQKFYDSFEAHKNLQANIELYKNISRTGDLIDLGSYNLVIDKDASHVLFVTNTSITIKADTFTGSVKTTGTVTLRNGATITGSVEDSAGVRVTVTQSGGGAFNILAYNGATKLGFDSGVTTRTYTVPKGSTVTVVSWQLGKKPFYRQVNTASGGVVLAMEMTTEQSVDTSLDVSTQLGNVAVGFGVDGNGKTDYSITFGAAMQLNLEQQKALFHRIYGDEKSLEAIRTSNGSTAITIKDDEITITQPIVFLRRDNTLSVQSRVRLTGFISTDAAIAIDPLYVIDPVRSDGTFVEINNVKPVVDYDLMASRAARAVQSDLSIIRDHARAANIQTQR